MLQAIAYNPYKKQKDDEEIVPGSSAKPNTRVVKQVLRALATQEPTRLPVAPSFTSSISAPSRPLPASVTDALQKMSWQPLSVSSHQHEEEGSTFASLALDSGVKAFIHRLPINNTAGCAVFGALKAEDKGFVGATVHSVAELVLDGLIETFGETFVESAVESGVDAAMLKAFVPTHSVVPWVVGAHAARIAADIVAQGLPAYSEDPLRHCCDPDGPYTPGDARILLAFVSIPSQCLGAAHHALAHALQEGLRAVGITDEQIKATLVSLGSVADLRHTDFGH